MAMDRESFDVTVRRVVAAGVVLGLGMGGFVDGILFHQILQVHSMLSARVARDTLVGLEVNMLWDGLFHAVTWAATAAGIAMLWRAASRGRTFPPLASFAGALLLGWGAFNLVEGIVDHHLLGVHHVIERADHLVPDLAFLASGAIMIVIGWLLVRPTLGADEPGGIVPPPHTHPHA